MDYKLEDLRVWDERICNVSNKRWLIYKHTNVHTGKSYIGQTIFTIEQRWQSHLSSAFKKNSNSPFHSSIRKHGPDAWTHEVLEEHIMNINTSNSRETFWIKKFRTNEKEFGYNCNSGGSVCVANATTRKKLSESAKKAQTRPEVREKQRQAKLGIKKSQDAIEKMRAKKIGMKHTLESRIKMSESHKGFKHNPESYGEETRKKMSEKQKMIQNNPETRMKAAKTRKENGFTHSEETRKLLSEKIKGQKRTQEFCDRVSKLNKESQNRPEVKQKRSKSIRESWNDPETRKKRCEAIKASWEKRRLEKAAQKQESEEEHGL